MKTRHRSRSLVIIALFAALAFLPTAGFAQERSKAKGPVKIFILAGQSNMEGKALPHTLDAVIDDPKTRDEFKHLKTDGKWTVRPDVWVTFLDKDGGEKSPSPLHGPLTVGFGSDKSVKNDNNKRVTVAGIGPELGIGWTLGDHIDQQVLLIKAAWGGRAVKYSFRPPSAMPTDDEIKAEVAAIKARKPDSTVTFESHKAGYGSDYRKILSETKRVIEDIKKYFPDYDESQGYEIAGFIWFQGWNDGVGDGNPKYTEQMAHFIRDMRRDLKAPKLPFVIGELGTDGTEVTGWVATFRGQQAAIAALPEFKGNVGLAKTASLWPLTPDLSKQWTEFRTLAQTNEKKAMDDLTRVEPGKFFQENWQQKYRKELAFTSDKRYHYLGSGACYYRMGQAMGRAMIELLE